MTEATLESLEETYDRWYSEDPHWEEAPGKSVLLEALARCLDSAAPLRLLDLGCGTGSFLARVDNEIGARWELVGMDISPIAIERARAQHPRFGFRCGDASHTGLEDASFDAVTCYGSWEHFPDPDQAIREASRVLVPGGWFFAMMPTLGVHRDDRTDEGWYEDLPVEGAERCQMQWNLRRETWAEKFSHAGLQLVADDLSRSCGAHKPGVFYFGVKLAQPESDVERCRGLVDLSVVSRRLASPLEPTIDRASVLVREALDAGGKLLACGNGGSAADAQHFVAEFVGRMTRERAPLPAVSLTTDPSVITALGNDYGYDNVFARQVEALGRRGDVLIAISTSGRSPNVLRALEAARARGLKTVALVGASSNEILAECDVTIPVPCKSTQIVQEIHTVVLHAICERVEASIPV